jgi:hypothetical protein
MADEEVFLMSPQEPASLDDRYFGSIPSTRLSAQAEPISTFAKLLGCYCCASSERELFGLAATFSTSFRPILRAL